MENVDYKVRELMNSHFYAQMDFHRTRIKNELELLRNEKGESFLDVGCGDALHSVRDQFKVVVGLDHNEPTLKRLKVFNRVLGEGESLPFKNEVFTCVGCHHLIEHIDNPENLIRELKRVLNKNGCLVISTPNYQSLWPLIEFIWGKLKFVNKIDYSIVHCHHFSPRKLQVLLEKFNFKILIIETYQPFLIPIRHLKPIFEKISKLSIFKNLGMVISIKAEKA